MRRKYNFFGEDNIIVNTVPNIALNAWSNVPNVLGSTLTAKSNISIASSLIMSYLKGALITYLLKF